MQRRLTLARRAVHAAMHRLVEAGIIVLATIPFVLGWCAGLAIRTGLWVLAVVLTASVDGYRRGRGQ